MATNARRWFDSASKELEFYCRKADDHFGHLSSIETPSDSDVVIRAEFSENDKEPRHALANLIQLVASAPPLLGGASKSDDRLSRELLRAKMNIGLGMWLCHYCIGWPQLLLWEELVALAVKLRAYPGEAFFHKLRGDAYRAERLSVFARQSKGLFLKPGGKSAATKAQASRRFDGLLVLAYSPIILLPEEHEEPLGDAKANEEDVETVAIMGSAGLFEVSNPSRDETAQSYRRYLRWTARMAYRYLRFQMWTYLRNSNLPLWYAVSQASAVRALENLADRAVHRAGKSGPTRADVLARLQNDSLKRINIFFGSSLKPAGDDGSQVERHLLVLEHDPDKSDDPQRGVTACALASADGVMASRPIRDESWQDCCFYLEGLPLAIEREKLKNLLLDYCNKTRSTPLRGRDLAIDPAWWKRVAPQAAPNTGGDAAVRPHA